MAGQVFAYIKHNDGVAEDSALELVVAGKKLGADATAIVVGSGVDALCTEMAATYKEVIKIDNADLAYPNAEVIRNILLNILPADAVHAGTANPHSSGEPEPESPVGTMAGNC